MTQHKQKNIIYIKSPNIAWIEIASCMKEKYNFNPVLWFPNDSKNLTECKSKFPESRMIAHLQALKVIRPNWFKETSSCTDANFLLKNAHHEDIFYNMMDRWSGNPEQISIEKRRAYYIDMANYWFAIYESLDADCVFIPTIPHRLYDYMAYVVAKYIGLPCLMVEESNEILSDEYGVRRSLYFLVDDISDVSKPIREQPDEQRIPSRHLQNYIDIFDADYNTIMPGYTKSKIKKIRWYFPIKKWVARLLPFIIEFPLKVFKHYLTRGTLSNYKLIFPNRTKQGEKSVQQQSVFRGLIRHNLIKKRVSKAEAFYRKMSVMPDLNSKFVYFAPHFQPERSSTPDSGLCQWQELMVEILQNSIPEDWKIYYKEHPSNFREPIMPDNVRSVGAYKELKYLAPKLEFINFEINPLQLIDHAQCVATGRGTSTWQAVTRNVPAICFGTGWYADCPGITHITSIAECKDFFEKLEKGKIVVNRAAVIQYLCKIEALGGDYSWVRGRATYKENYIQPKSEIRYSIEQFSEDAFKLYQKCLAPKEYLEN